MRQIIGFSSWFIIAFLLITIAVPEISITNPFHYCADQSVYYMMASSWLKGILPYRDLFDHKAPLLYLIYSLGILIAPGKLGISILLTFFLGISFIYAYRFSKLFVSKTVSIYVTLLYIVICSGAISGGPEDFSLPFILIPFYYIIRHILRYDYNVPLKIWIFSGTCFGIHAMIRLNNAGVLCGAIAALCVLFIAKRQYYLITRNILLFLLSSLIFIMVILSYFVINNCVYQCIECSFLFNLFYSTKGIIDREFKEWVYILTYISPVWLILVSSFILYKSKKLKPAVCFVSIASAAIGSIALIPGRAYLHYFLIFSPCVIIAIVFSALCIKRVRNKTLTYFLSILSIIFYTPFVCYSAYDAWRGGLALFPHHHWKHRYESDLLTVCQTIKKIIPSNELNSVLYYNGQGNVYLYLGAVPPTRFFILQDFLMMNAPMYKKEFEASLYEKNSPKWIIGREHSGKLGKNATLQKCLDSYYEEVNIPNNKTNFRLFKKAFQLNAMTDEHGRCKFFLQNPGHCHKIRLWLSNTKE